MDICDNAHKGSTHIGNVHTGGTPMDIKGYGLGMG